jgi:hypothetical protein
MRRNYVLTKLAGAATALLLAASPAAADTILTFDVLGITDHGNINQAYGDRVAGPADASGSYGTDGLGFTPNVVVGYGTSGEDPALWTTGYGNLTNIYFNDADGDTTLTTRFTADAGYLVNLVSFDIASFINGGQTIQGARALNALTNAVLWSIGSTAITGSTSLSLAPDVTAADIFLEISLAGLGSLSDDIGLDNIRFGQELVAPTAVPEPATMSLLGIGLAAVWLKRTRAATAR